MEKLMKGLLLSHLLTPGKDLEEVVKKHVVELAAKLVNSSGKV